MSTAAEDQATSVAERNSSDPQAPAANGPRNATASQPIPNGVDSNGGGGGGGGSSAAMHTAAAGGDRGAAGGSVAGSGGGGGSSDKMKQEWQRVKQCVDESVATKLKLLKVTQIKGGREGGRDEYG